jgi:hypothetical protein
MDNVPSCILALRRCAVGHAGLEEISQVAIDTRTALGKSKRWVVGKISRVVFKTKAALGKSKRWSAVLHRWGDILVLALLGGSITALVLRILPDCTELPSFIKATWLPSLIILVGACLVFGRKRFPAWAGIRHLPFYPPAWLAGLFSFIALCIYLSLYPAASMGAKCALFDDPLILQSYLRSTATWSSLAVVVVVLMSAWVGSSLLGTRSDLNKARKELGLRSLPSAGWRASRNLLASNFNELKKWLQDDQPINRPHLDGFGRTPIAQRLFSRLTTTEDKGPTVALIGGLGSGKSSILNIVIYQLLASRVLGKKVGLVRISLWPFDTVNAAIRGVLEAVTEELRHHVNTGPIAGLPDEYVEIIENAGVGWAGLFKSSRSPVAVLADYDAIASAIGLHLILWIEDLERFSGTITKEEHQEVERLGPIRSLLYILSEFNSFQVVLASASLSTRFDIEKIARIVEMVPSLEPMSVWGVLSRFRDGCMQELVGLIDPATPDARRHLSSPADSSSLEFLLQAGSINSLPLALATLCNNPRRLKYGLRHCLDAWMRLKGEIDFDDIFAMSILRSAEPDVFALVGLFIDDLRDGVRRSPRTTTREETLFAKKLGELLGKEASARRTAIEEVLGFVFPGWQLGEPPSRLRYGKPQGLAVRTPRDYWARYLALASIEDAEKDQSILSAIEAWKNQAPSALVRMLVSNDRLDVVEAFVGVSLGKEHLVRLLGEVVLAEIDRSVKDWGAEQPPAVVSLWRAMLSRVPAQSLLVEVLQNLLPSVVEKNLSLAHTIIYLFAHREPSVTPLLPDANIEQLNQRFRALLVEVFRSGGPDQLVQALEDGSAFALYWSCWGLARVRQHDFSDVPFEGWPEFSEIVLAAAEKDPVVMLPQIVPFVTDRQDKISLDDGEFRPLATYSFDDGLARRLFSYDRLMRILAPKIAFASSSEELRLRYEVAHEAGIRHVAGHG